ncbi:related to Deoxyribodipyrimidine photolyase [Sporisorium reilianum SRZ2]|uniref:Related to Deoxyribodipyrimidine photolyase n=1 Tax=Sporisorium reilianum (strain SRZ2) TaxID=999809 RepID=E6ZZN0_SPORE|nr:related to Deoxyribodipyrimidine photolyase [Sporisorium reilianum SRZ2]
MSKAARVLYWFRTDLRLHDSPALQAALDLKPAALFPVWCWDPNYVYKHRVGINRFRFLLESMTALSKNITSTQSKSQLLVVRGEPTELLPELWKRWNITHLVIEKDPSAYGRRRDRLIREAAKKSNVEVVAVQGHHLYDPEEVVKRNKGKPTMALSTLQKIVANMGDVPKPIDAPTDLPLPTLNDSKSKPLKDTLSELATSLDGLPHYTGKGREGPASVDLNSSELGGQRDEKVTCYETVSGDASELFGVPTLASLGMDASKVRDTIKGGEPLALEKLAKICKDAEYVATFAKPKTSPGDSAEDPSTTLMSPYLKFGCLSVRKFWWDVEEAKKKYKGGSKTGPPENLNGQLLFRDMYACAEHAIGDDFQRVRGNEVCRYMDWYLPTQYDKNGEVIVPRPAGDAVSEARLSAYKLGQTGFPWIDALMRQLRLEGWMHHLGRHSVAAFLTRGQCWISWERGAEIFDEYLIDWDPCSNPGNWMWLSCSAFFTQYFRLYGLATFPAKYDKTGALVRKYFPELAKFPDKYIYEPFNAPKDVQQQAGCIIGKDYPFPMLDEKETKGDNMQRMKICYQANLHGTSKEVLEGKADAMLRKKHGFKDAPEEFDWSNRPGAKIPDWAKAPKGEEHTTEGAPNGGNGASAKKEEEDEEDSDDVAYGQEEEQKEERDGKKRKAAVKEENGKSRKKK